MSKDPLELVSAPLPIMPLVPLNVEEVAKDPTIQKTNDVVISEIRRSRRSYPEPLLEKITNPSENSRAVAQAVSSSETLRQAPNVGWEVLKVGLMKLNEMDGDLNVISESVEEIQNNLERLLQVNRQLMKLPIDQKSHVITEDLKKSFAHLKELGIDLLSDDAKELSSEKLIALKAEIDSLKTKYQTDVQTKFMKIQTKTQQYNSMIDSLKMIERYINRLNSTIINNMGKR